MGDDYTGFFDSYTNFISPVADDIFSTLDDEFTSMAAALFHAKEVEHSPVKRKRQKFSPVEDGQQKVAHITVERNQRKQMNEHLAVLRSLLPCFYVKRGDQASIIGVVVDYITELQQVLQSLEARKQRKVVYSDHILSPRPPLPPISPTTPQSATPYRPRLQQPKSSSSYLLDPSPSSNSSSSSEIANSKSPIADVEVKFSGSNLLLKTVSPRLPGQTTKIVSVLEDLDLP